MDTSDRSKQLVRVTIFNQTYTLSAAGDPADTEELAHHVDELMSSIARRAGNLDTARTAVLACLHLADELKQTQAKLQTLKESVDSKTRDFTMLLDQALPTDETA
jgi:cell division protein ZapA